MISLQAVNSRRDLKSFIFLPRELYRQDSYWVPPLWHEELKGYGKRKNPILAHSEYVLLLASKNGRVVGRNLVYVDRHFNRFNRTRIGFFGAFECTPDPEVASVLLAESEEWLRSRGMTSVRGPIHPLAESWGFLHQGFEDRPMFMAPYNPACYNEFIIMSGYRKVKDLLAFEAGAREDYQIPDRFRRFRQFLLARNPGLSFRRLSMKTLLADAEHIWSISNQVLRHNWGYVPLDRREFMDMFKRLRLIVDPDVVWFVEDRNTPVGYALGFPDLNMVLKKIGGRIFPFGFLTLLRGIKRVREYRLFGLAVLPEYHNLGLDVLLYMSVFDALKPKAERLEANYVLEDNYGIRNALEKLKLRHTKTYRVYQKELL